MKDELDEDLDPVFKDHWNNLIKIKEKSEDDFDKNITAIAAGTLAVTLTFHQIIVKAGETQAHWLLFFSWIALGLLMISNLFTNYISIRQIQSSLNELNENYTLDNKKNENRIKLMDRLNLFKILLLTLGLIGFLTYVIINMETDNTPKEEKDKAEIGTRSIIPVPRKLRANNPAIKTDSTPDVKPEADTKKD